MIINHNNYDEITQLLKNHGFKIDAVGANKNSIVLFPSDQNYIWEIRTVEQAKELIKNFKK